MPLQKMRRFYSLLFTVIAFSGVFVFLALVPVDDNRKDDNRQTLQWRRFDVKEIEQSVNDGKLVLVFGNPLYHIEGGFLKEFFSAPEVAKALGNTNVDLFYLEYQGWYDEGVDALFELTRRIKEPIVVFMKKGQQPQYFDAGTRSEILTFAAACNNSPK